jgi:short subunit dehydrogenase-like uncharacterized protein
MSRLDVIIFGASGYSGKIIAEIFDQIAAKEKRNISWGIAGRSLQKLQNVLDELESKLGETCNSIYGTTSNSFVLKFH